MAGEKTSYYRLRVQMCLDWVRAVGGMKETFLGLSALCMQVLIFIPMQAS